MAQKKTKRRPPRSSHHKTAPAKEKVANNENVINSESGLTIIFTQRGNGEKLQVGQTVLVNYTGMFTNGKKFDSSLDRHEPFAFKLGTGQVIKGWDEGIAQLRIGDHAIFVVPPSLGYGERGAGNVIPPNTTLVFIIEALETREGAISELLFKTINEQGIDAAITQFNRLKADKFPKVYMSEAELNGLGYRLIRQSKIKEAIEILKLNCAEYPNSANVYDSLAEVYLVSGNKEEAIANYRKSLQLDPQNSNASEILKRLGEK